MNVWDQIAPPVYTLHYQSMKRRWLHFQFLELEKSESIARETDMLVVDWFTEDSKNYSNFGDFLFRNHASISQ